MNKFVSTGDLCKEFGLSLSTIYRWIKSGTIKEKEKEKKNSNLCKSF